MTPTDILERHVASLDPPDWCPVPDWFFCKIAEATPLTVRGWPCIAYRLAEPTDGVVGFVLDVEGNVSRAKYAHGGPDPLALVGRW